MPAGTCRVERRSHSRGRRRRRREETRNARRLAGLCGRLGQRDEGPGAPVPRWPRKAGAHPQRAVRPLGDRKRVFVGAAPISPKR
jgi:hypothetical protein